MRDMLKITLKRGYVGIPEKQRKVLRALGLKKIGNAVTRRDDEAIRGMIKRVPHLIAVEKAED
jgi:large subunit ribosomal protein L30